MVELVVLILLPIATSIPLGLYMAKLFSGQRTFLDPVLAPV